MTKYYRRMLNPGKFHLNLFGGTLVPEVFFLLSSTELDRIEIAVVASRFAASRLKFDWEIQEGKPLGPGKGGGQVEVFCIVDCDFITVLCLYIYLQQGIVNLIMCLYFFQVNSWGSWGACSEKCAVGSKQRARTIKISKRCRGKDCPTLKVIISHWILEKNAKHLCASLITSTMGLR